MWATSYDHVADLSSTTYLPQHPMGKYELEPSCRRSLLLCCSQLLRMVCFSKITMRIRNYIWSSGRYVTYVTMCKDRRYTCNILQCMYEYIDYTINLQKNSSIPSPSDQSCAFLGARRRLSHILGSRRYWSCVYRSRPKSEARKGKTYR